MLGWLHIFCAVAALCVGAAVFFRRKGTRTHRVLGYLYSVLLLLVNVSALSTYNISGQPGPFHVMALVSLATLVAGLMPAVLRRPRTWWLDLHAYFMSWSYVGLAAAGVSQIVTQYAYLPGSLAIVVPSVAIVVCGALLIHTRVPNLLVELVAGGAGPEQRFRTTHSA